jgi:hypothetical protein
MNYKTISTTWMESLAAAATLTLGALIVGDAYLQHESQQQAAAAQAMPLVRLEPVTITAQRTLVQLEPVTISAQRTVHTAQAAQAATAHLPRI